jgi:hypothetical protein
MKGTGAAGAARVPSGAGGIVAVSVYSAVLYPMG